ncbi:MAG: serine hydrolase domain-containing protein [Acidimicrobiales bacterium]
MTSAASRPLGVNGSVTPGYERVAQVLGEGTSVLVGRRERRADLGDGGGAFCAFVDGECVVDLWAGPAGPGRMWEEGTRAVIMSSTKGMTTLCAHLLEDRGQLDLEAPVVRYWPEFGTHGKSSTTVRQLLSHQSGAIGLPGSDELLSWDGGGWSDTVSIAAGVASGVPAWDPGTRHGYHGVTFGWLVGELVRRISGASLGAYFDAEVARPLGVGVGVGVAGSISIGTPPADLGSVATVMEFPLKPGREGALRTIDPDSRSGRSVLAGAHGNLFADEEGRPRFADFMNTPAVLRAEIGALGATSTARALARVYAALAAGEELVSRASVERFRAEQVCGRDAVMSVPTRWAVGYSLEPPALVPGVPPMHGPDDEAFGHMGAGGQIGFADPVARVGCAFVRNHLENQALPLMGACLVDVLYSCLDGSERGGGVRS